MREIIATNQELCVGCNRCTRVCPVETANLTYQDEAGDIKVRVNPGHCIACGNCISACHHGARAFTDDTTRFFADLAAGEPISLMVAPSVRSNFREWRRLLSWMRRLGVRHVYDVSLGADLCVWAHLRHLDEDPSARLITQPCPAVVSYAEVHQNGLLQHLSPVHSPMGCCAVLMRKYEGVTGRIAALSPCIAKGNEFEDIDVEYNVVYSRLREYMEENAVVLPDEEGDFDHPEAGLGTVFPMPGGFKENIEFYRGTEVNVWRSEGGALYDNLDAYLKAPEALRPRVFDVLSCADGCNMGPGAAGGPGLFEVNTVMDRRREKAVGKGVSHYNALLEQYDKRFDVRDFLRAYTPRPVEAPPVGQADILNAFARLGKDTEEKQRVDCGACGCTSCRDMARRIALGVDIPLNCIMKSRSDLQDQYERSRRLYKRNAEYVWLIHRLGDYLLSESGDVDAVVQKSLKALCETMDSNSASVWENEYDAGGALGSRRTMAWPAESVAAAPTLNERQLPHWLGPLSRGEHILVQRSTMDDTERMLFSDPSINTMLVVPVHVKGRFWGLFSLNCERERNFDDEDISVVVACALLVVYCIIEGEMTQSLIAAREDALAGTRAKSDFLSRMSHEMRTPMNAIIGMTKIADATGNPERIRHCLSTIQTSSTQLLGLINDVLDMSKIEAGKFQLDEAPFRLEDVIGHTRELVVEKAAEKQQDLQVEVVGGGWFLGDALRLSQVITNLLSNAVKFTGEGGAVRLMAECFPGPGGTDIVQILVADTGIGMTEEQIGRLFTTFEQADNSIARRFGGSGLGLAISKSIIEQMGGGIAVESTPGAGTTFTVELRLTRCEAPAVAEAPATDAGVPDFSGVQLLLAEDIEVNREVFAALLEETGVSIDMAVNGREAVERYAADPARYHLVVMDIMMPEMDGYDATRAIRALDDPRGKTVPIIAMTANAFKEDIDRCLAAGMNDHLAKPIDEKALMEKIAFYLGQAPG